MRLARPVVRAVWPSGWDVMTAVRYRHNGRIWELLSRPGFRAASRAELLHNRTTDPLSEIDGNMVSAELRSHLVDPLRSVRQRERLTALKGTGYVVPDGGWLIDGSRRLVESCLIDADYAARPDFRRYVRARVGIGEPVSQVPRLVHLRDWGETNYWHFLNDIVGGRLRLAQKHGLCSDVPLLLGRRALERPFVQAILASTALAHMKIVVQGDELVRFREAFYFETPRHSLESVEFFLSFLGASGGESSGTKRVFLTRGGQASRRISNLAEVQVVCQEKGFEAVQPDALSLREQMRLFSQVRYLVAEHGAGLTNMAFRRGAPLAVLEIFPGWTYDHGGGLVGPPPPHYFWLAHALGFEYDAMAGESSPTGAFIVDPAQLALKLSTLLGKG